eukprot:1161631-Pelagomonas_calceolata.AAC.3
MKLKQLLSAHGETLRVYCAPEDPRARKIRKRKGGNTGVIAFDGWQPPFVNLEVDVMASDQVLKDEALASAGARLS